MLQDPRLTDTRIEINSPGTIFIEVDNDPSLSAESLIELRLSAAALLLEGFSSPGGISPIIELKVCGQPLTDQQAQERDPSLEILVGRWLSTAEIGVDTSFRLSIDSQPDGDRLLTEFMGLNYFLMEENLRWRSRVGLEGGENTACTHYSVPANRSSILSVDRGPLLIVPITSRYLYLRGSADAEGGAFRIIDAIGEPHYRYRPLYLTEESEIADLAFDPGLQGRVSLWRAFTISGIRSYEYDIVWQEKRYEDGSDRYLILGDGLHLQIDGKEAEALDAPFYAVVTIRGSCSPLHIHGEPFITVLQLHDDAECRCPPLGIMFSGPRREEGADIRLEIQDSTGQVRSGTSDVISFGESDVVEALLRGIASQRAPAGPATITLSGLSARTSLNGDDIRPSPWDKLPEGLQWLVLSVLTFLWLPIARAVWNYVFPTDHA